jgi:dTDP-4-dehydrorhamnose 3,5-epimerase
MPIEGHKAKQTVTPEGKEVRKFIDGVQLRYAVNQTDDRGTICEVYNPAWGMLPDPLVYIYKVTVRPGKTKGWSMHKKQTDRLFAFQGALKVVLYDDRPESPTYKQLDVIYLGEEKPGLVIIPTHVYHAVQNVDGKTGCFLSMPTIAYNHADPDRFRMPLDSKEIPYDFTKNVGW